MFKKYNTEYIIRGKTCKLKRNISYKTIIKANTICKKTETITFAGT